MFFFLKVNLSEVKNPPSRFLALGSEVRILACVTFRNSRSYDLFLLIRTTHSRNFKYVLDPMVGNYCQEISKTSLPTKNQRVVLWKMVEKQSPPLMVTKINPFTLWVENKRIFEYLGHFGEKSMRIFSDFTVFLITIRLKSHNFE